MRHEFYNRERFPHYVTTHGNFELWADASGYCASIPTEEAEAIGCKASHFGDRSYVRATLGIEVPYAR